MIKSGYLESIINETRQSNYSLGEGSIWLHVTQNILDSFNLGGVGIDNT